MDGTWTIGELAELAAGALTTDPPLQLSGRVREMPNDRLIRWYVTVGLVDPPLSRAGRIARYGRRHLLQLVAVKRRQAQGCSLAEIQTELLGATDAYLDSVARLPADGSHSRYGPVAIQPAEVRPIEVRPSANDRFWRRGAAPGSPDSAGSPENAGSTDHARAPEHAGAPGHTEHAELAAPAEPGLATPAGPPAAARAQWPAAAAGLMRGIRLAPGVLLLLDAEGAERSGPLPADAAELRAAAAPLLEALARHGYTGSVADQERNRT